MAQLTLDQALRLDIIKLLGPDADMGRANIFYDFVMGDTGQGTLPLNETEYPPAGAKTDAPSTEPGVRKRRTKAEIEAGQAKEPQVNSPEYLTAQDKITEAILATSEAPVPAKQVDYKEVQIAVLALCKADRKDKVVEVLNQFGIPTALELKPEQYAEALDLFVAALND